MTVNREKTQQAAERHVRRGNWDKAIGLYQELVHSDPNDLRSKLKLADLYTRVDDTDKAVRTYIEVGQGHERFHEYDKAAAVYKVARAAVPDNLEISELLGDLYAKMGRNKEALQVLGEVYLGYSEEDDSKKAQSVLETMTLLDPEDVGLKIQLAERYKKAQDTQRALSVFYDAADLLRNEGRSDELFQVMQRILFLSPDSLDARKEVIKGLLERGEEKKALQHFRTAVTAAPDDLELLGLLGQTFETLESFDNAVEVYEKMISIYGGQAYKPRVQQLQDRILLIAPDHPTSRRIKAERAGHTELTGASEADTRGFDLLSGDDLFGDRDILDDVEFLDDPFGVIGTGVPVAADVDPNESTRFSQNFAPIHKKESLDDFDFIKTATHLEAEHATEVSQMGGVGLDAPTHVHTGAGIPGIVHDDAPTQEDAEPATFGRKDVSHLLKRVESFFQFNLFAQADELTRDIINLAPDNFNARDQRRRICETLGNTEEAADQLMEMARICVEDPRLSSKYLSRAMTLTNTPQRFEQYAAHIRSLWEDAAHQPGPPPAPGSERRAFSLPRPSNASDSEGNNATVAPGIFGTPHNNNIPFQQITDSTATLEDIQVDSFEDIDINQIPSNIIGDDVDTFFVPENKQSANRANTVRKEGSFDLGFLDKESDPKDRFSNIFSDIDIDFSKFGEQSLSSAFLSKDIAAAALAHANAGVEGETIPPSNQLNSLEVGEVFLQSGRYQEAIETLEPLLNDAEDRVNAQLLLADVYTELGDVPKAAEFLLCVINEEVSTPEQRTEAQSRLSKLA